MIAMALFTDTEALSNVLVKTIKGYHLINTSPIKEAVWETILCSALDSIGAKYEYSNGSHQSGVDIVLDTGSISCKSCKETRTSLSLSSYRMTTCKTIEEFVKEIDVVRANFSHYALISRIEAIDDITYNIYLIPSSLIKAGDKQWTIKHKRVDVNTISQWDTIKTDGVQFSIKAAMSNQLWINLDKDIFKTYLLCRTIVVPRKKMIDYCSLFDRLSISSTTSSEALVKGDVA